jgi:hypothetical protein
VRLFVLAGRFGEGAVAALQLVGVLEPLAMGTPAIAYGSGGVDGWHRGPGLVPCVEALADAARRLAGRIAAAREGFDRGTRAGRALAPYAKLAA